MELVGRKLGMTQIFDERGDRIPVTVVRAGPCQVVQIKSPERDGYCAVQLGFEDVKEKRATRPLRGHFAKAGVSPKRVLFEVRLSQDEAGKLEVGKVVLCAEGFAVGQMLDVRGNTRGRGFSGVVRRHGMPTRTSSHGTHEYFRHGGSIGPGTDPGRVLKGLRMPGRLGNERVTTRNLKLVKVDPERHLLYIRGAVPGHPNSLVRVRPAVNA